MTTASLWWPGDHRAGELFGEAAYARALVRVEAAWLTVLADAGRAPAGAAEAVAAVDLTAAELTAVATEAEDGGNPVVPLLRVLRDQLTVDQAQWLHRGLTSQDVVDTALMLCARDLLDQVNRDLERMVTALIALTTAHRSTLMVGRTLTQHAVPITFGLKVAGWLQGVLDARHFVRRARAELPVQCGGAAGTLAAIVTLSVPGSGALSGLDGSDRLAAALGLRPSLPWHTRRTPVTTLGDALVSVTDALGHLATDTALLSRPEIAELSEAAADGRGGSSTMPQKRNPVLSVLIRRAAANGPLLSAQLHLAAAQSGDERPDGAWHSEWAPLAALGRQTVAAAAQAADLVEGLDVHPDTMATTLARALPGVLAERESIRAVLGESPGLADPSDYLGATEAIIDAVLRRAEPGPSPRPGRPEDPA